jgi:hypothetical protein
MHISLDSALGRQRRLNSVGESITQIAPDPAAAYSLRSLTGGDPKVVRVRRGSDNHEQDFTASDVSSGALQDFVNAQVTAPLDIQALSATGRDGDFLIAKAAYSLRSLGTRQATLAATGDTVDRANGQFVCQVRRPSDDALKSFTAAEVTDGTLLSFVTEEVTLVDATDFSSSLPSPLSSSTAGVLSNTFGQSIGGSDNVVLVERTSASTSGVPFRYLGQPNIFEGDTATLTVEVFLPNSNVSTGLRLLTSNLSSGAVHNIQITKGSWQAISVTGTMTSDSSFNNWRVQGWVDSSGNEINNANEKVYLRKYELKVKSSDGFVKTWYDQSVTTQAGDTATGNHATQATAASQPKIVSAGALLTDGVTFDGGDSLSVSGDPVITASSSGVFSAFSVQTVATSEAGYLYGNTSASNGASFYAAVNKFTLSNQLNVGLDNISRSSGQNLLSAVYNNGDAGLLVNGAGTMTDAGTYTFSTGTGDFVIGNRNGGSASATFLTGSINEIIIYNSNQSDNRTAIEANIGEAYSIDLPSGVDPGFDQVDGFVETWYDQSGNGNNAVQATASLQPKIVNAGSLLADGVTFDGSDDVLTSGFNSSLTNYTFAGVYTVKTITDNTGLLGKGAGSSDREFFVRMKANSTIEHRIHSTGSASPLFQIASDVTISANTTVLLAGSFNDGTNAMRLDLNGTEKTATSSIDLHSGTSSLTIASALGSEAHTAVAELLFYNTDESGKLSDIKTNINSHYSIF